MKCGEISSTKIQNNYHRRRTVRLFLFSSCFDVDHNSMNYNVQNSLYISTMNCLITFATRITMDTVYEVLAEEYQTIKTLTTYVENDGWLRSLDKQRLVDL